jgi:hypothetical protein
MMRSLARLLAVLLTLPLALALHAADAPKYDHTTFSGLHLRGIGPAMPSGRIGDLAVDPRDTRVWYVAVASGGVYRSPETSVQRSRSSRKRILDLGNDLCE